jgi:hypothetical protein
MTAWNKQLDALRAMIAAQCGLRMERDGKVSGREIAAWLLRHKRAAVIAALSDLVGQEMERRNDEDRVKHVLRVKPELRDRELPMRLASQTLNVPMSYLLQLDDETSEACFAADLLIHRLRLEESAATLEAMERTQELLRPVNGMTIGEAFHELQRQTDETIRGLDREEEL